MTGCDAGPRHEVEPREAGMGRPDLSVVIAARDAAAVIVECLTALCSQPGSRADEIVVADSSRDDTPRLVETFPGVRLLHFDEPLTIPELRGRGIAATDGGIVAILDPFAMVGEHWRQEVLAAHERYPHPVVGGAVSLHESCRNSHVAWAAYINEYGMFLPPVEGGAATILPGCNVSYKRAALFAGETPRFPVFWKTFVNWELQASGSRLWLVPEIEVRLRKPIPFPEFLRSRFDHGRCFAGMRSREWGWPRRVVHSTAAFVLPGLLLWRWSLVYWRKGTERNKLLATLPLQVLLFGVWSAGEAWGYLLGVGQSCRRLFY